MHDSSHLPDSVSHKQLDSLLKTAHKHLQNSEIKKGMPSEEEAFMELLISWSSTSKDLLGKLSQKDACTFKEKPPHSLMALGALEAHLSMAIQAYKAWDVHNE